MKAKITILIAAMAISAASHAGELNCADRIAQGSVAVVRVIPTDTVQIDLPPGVHVGSGDLPDAGTKIYYKGGATDRPLVFPMNNGRYEVCAVLVKSGEKPDQHVVLNRRNP